MGICQLTHYIGRIISHDDNINLHVYIHKEADCLFNHV